MHPLTKKVLFLPLSWLVWKVPIRLPKSKNTRHFLKHLHGYRHDDLLRSFQPHNFREIQCNFTEKTNRHTQQLTSFDSQFKLLEINKKKLGKKEVWSFYWKLAIFARKLILIKIRKNTKKCKEKKKKNVKKKKRKRKPKKKRKRKDK